MSIRLLKKAPIARALNVSGRDFERKLDEGIIPSPHCWVSDNKRGRRWSAADIERVFGHVIQ
jgi:hypothetical protein